MDFQKRVILVNHPDLVGIVFENAVKERGVHAGAERALKIIEIDDGNLGAGIALNRTALDVNFRHQVLGNVDLLYVGQGFTVSRYQKFMIGRVSSTGEGHNQVVITGRTPWLGIGNGNVYLRGHIVARANLDLYPV